MDAASSLSLKIETLEQAKQWQDVVMKSGDHDLQRRVLSALWLFRSDYDLLYRIIQQYKDSKFERLYTGVAVDEYLAKYNRGIKIDRTNVNDYINGKIGTNKRKNGPEIAITALAMKALFYTDGDIYQSDRIVQRSQLFKLWGTPEMGMSFDWNGFPATVDLASGVKAKWLATRGEYHLQDLLNKMELNSSKNKQMEFLRS